MITCCRWSDQYSLMVSGENHRWKSRINYSAYSMGLKMVSFCMNHSLPFVSIAYPKCYLHAISGEGYYIINESSSHMTWITLPSTCINLTVQWFLYLCVFSRITNIWLFWPYFCLLAGISSARWASIDRTWESSGKENSDGSNFFLWETQTKCFSL